MVVSTFNLLFATLLTGKVPAPGGLLTDGPGYVASIHLPEGRSAFLPEGCPGKTILGISTQTWGFTVYENRHDRRLGLAVGADELGSGIEAPDYKVNVISWEASWSSAMAAQPGVYVFADEESCKSAAPRQVVAF